MKRQVPDDDGIRERHAECVPDAHPRSRHGARKSRDAVFVNVNRGERPSEPRERHGESTVTSAELEYRAARRGGEPGDAVDRRAVDKEVLAELVSATVL